MSVNFRAHSLAEINRWLNQAILKEDKNPTQMMLELARRNTMKFDELTPEEQEQMREFWKLTKQPPEYFNRIINSGMCNSIIKGYVLIALDELGLTNAKSAAEVNSVITHLFDDYSAEEAREREKG